jgi:AraC-like DNA-binding protein
MLPICAQEDLNRPDNILSYARHEISLCSENGVLIDRRGDLNETVRASDECLFRERYRQEWIIAVGPQEFRHSVMLFAVNRHKRIAGADRYRRALPSNHDLSFERAPAERGLSSWALFQSDSAPFRFPNAGDIHASLVPIGTTEVWSCLVTPPDGAATAWPKADAYLHVRPRILSLGSVRLLTSTPRARGGRSSGVLRRACKYIDANLQTNIDLRTLSKIAGLSVWYFGRTFKQSIGGTPHRYLIHRRLHKARHLVADSNLPPAEIAIRSGFSDQSHFTRRFTRYFDLSPGPFRRSQR